MNLQPRNDIFKILLAFAEHVKKNNKSPFGDARNKSNSIVDAEMLLVLLLPYAEIGNEFSLNDYKEPPNTLVGILNEMANKKNEEKALFSDSYKYFINLLNIFFVTHSDDKGNPTFGIGSYGVYKDYENDVKKRLLSANDEKIEIVDSYAMSLTLCIYVLRLLDAWHDTARKRNEAKYLTDWKELHGRVSKRLTGAMRGLLSSFAISTMDKANWYSFTGHKWSKKLDGRMADIRSRLLKLGAKELATGDTFECGWSWGPVHEEYYIIPGQDENIKKTWVESTNPFVKPLWYAIPAPYLYFTVTALDSIMDLKGSEVMAGGLLNNEQLILADRLRSFAEVTSQYWSTLAFGDAHDSWRIEDIPWYPTDGNASDYWTLYVLRLVGDKLPWGDVGINRVIDLMEELAQRARITRRPFPLTKDQSVIDIHLAGFRLILTPYADTYPEMVYPIYDFSPQLLKQAALILRLPLTDNQRARLYRVIQGLWVHLSKRTNSRTYSWDYPENIYKEAVAEYSNDNDLSDDDYSKVRSWYYTERVVEALIALHRGESWRPKSNEQFRSIIATALAEAEWRVVKEYDPQERPAALSKLNFARTQLDDDPLLALSVVVGVGEWRLNDLLKKKKSKDREDD